MKLSEAIERFIDLKIRVGEDAEREFFYADELKTMRKDIDGIYYNQINKDCNTSWIDRFFLPLEKE